MSDLLGALLPYFPDYAQAAQISAETSGVSGKFIKSKQAFKEDLQNANNTERAKGLFAIGAFIWEWGPINEYVAVLPTITVLESTGNPALAGAVGGLVYTAQQIGLGLTTSLGIESIPKTEHVIRNEFNTLDERGASKLDRGLLLLGAGASAVVINEHIRNENQNFRKDAKLLGKLAIILGAVDVAVFSSASFAIENSEKVNVDPNDLIDMATNPWTYVAIFGLLKASGYYKKYRKVSLTNNNEPN